MLKQPIGMKFYTNISIVRLKLGKTRYEIACYKNKIQDWRDKKETDLSEVLQTNTIFKNIMSKDFGSIEYDENEFLNVGQEYLETNQKKLDKAELHIIDVAEEIKTDEANKSK